MMRAKESKDFSSEKREKSADFSAFKRIEFRLCLAKTKKHSRRSASARAATQRLPYGQEIEPDSAKPCREVSNKQSTT